MEPASNTVAGVAIATGAITISGSIFGLQWDALLFGLFGGLVSLMHLPVMSKGRMAGTLATAAIMGALAAPFAHAAIGNYAAWLIVVGKDLPRFATAFIVGLTAQWLIPIVLGKIKARGAAE